MIALVNYMADLKKILLPNYDYYDGLSRLVKAVRKEIVTTRDYDE